MEVKPPINIEGGLEDNFHEDFLNQAVPRSVGESRVGIVRSEVRVVSSVL